MPEADHAAEAEDQIQAGGRQPEDQDAGGKGDVVPLAGGLCDGRQQQKQRQGREQDDALAGGEELGESGHLAKAGCI